MEVKSLPAVVLSAAVGHKCLRRHTDCAHAKDTQQSETKDGKASDMIVGSTIPLKYVRRKQKNAFFVCLFLK